MATIPFLPLTNVVTISVAEVSPGINAYNTSNLAIVTDESPNYSSETLSFSIAPTDGTFELMFPGGTTAAINWNDSVAVIQSKVNTVSGCSQIIVSGSIASQKVVLSQPGQLGAVPVAVVVSNALTPTTSISITSFTWSGASSGFAFYLNPTQVGVDFGTGSVTYQQAVAVFSQAPNILNGGGQLIVILSEVSVQTLAFSAVPTSGTFQISYNSNLSAEINWDDSAQTIQANLQANVPGLEDVQVTGSIAGGLLTLYLNGVYGVALPISTANNTLSPATVITPATVSVGEKFVQVLQRTVDLVSYFGVMPNQTLAVIGKVDLLAAAAFIQSQNTLMGFFVSYNVADIMPGGMLDLLRSGSFTQSRGLYYGDSSNGGLNASLMMAAYAGRGLSVDFNGSNTTINMHLKVLPSIQPDPTMTQTILNYAQNAGADCYVSLQGVPAVFTSGENKYFDQVYNLLWFVGALQVAGFNFLAQTATKVPQTELGMDGLKNAYRAVCDQAVTNQYSAPGTWTSPDTFGNQQLFLDNVLQYGYYIYSLPISQQAAAARMNRVAPLVQIALKEAGGINSSSVLVFINP